MLKFYFSKSLIILFLIATGISVVSAQSDSRTFWANAKAHERKTSGRSWYPNHYQSYSLQIEELKRFLKDAPMETDVASRHSSFVIELPVPGGNFNRYTLLESPIMEHGLADAFPTIKTYAGQGIDDPSATIRCDITLFGFHSYVLSPNGTIYIDPIVQGNTEDYIVYYKRDIHAELYKLNCLVKSPGDNENELNPEEERIPEPASTTSVLDNKLRTERLALACTGEYAATYGGTVAGALSGMVTTMNRVNGVYESELDIHMNLVANDTLIIYTNANTDPYTNGNPSSLLSQNQTTCTNIIGSANYDIGHVFSTAGGGLSALSVICNSSTKAEGETGTNSPIGDAFDIDYVAHEMGHQHGANHTFNSVTGSCSGGNRAGSAAYEPGSASTIMGYAGICGSDDLQPHSDAYFHTKSFDEIVTYTQSGGGNACPVKTTIANSIPTLTIPTITPNIPIKTPFRLMATGSDADGDLITYCWEEWDLGGIGQAWNVQTSGVNAPIYRSFTGVSSGTKLLPKLARILTPTSTDIGEVMPIYARVLHFRCTVRDNHSMGGGVFHSASTANVNVVASDTGGFAILTPNTTGITWAGLSTQTVTWYVAGTTASPISTPNINIYLSTDNGQTFPYTIATNVPNNGSYSFSVPNVATTTARIMVEGAGNIFFDINDKPFTITFTTGIDENVLSNSVNVYPNPSSGTTHFVVNTPSFGKSRITVNDITGRTVKEINFEKSTPVVDKSIDLTDISSGLYLIRFELPEGIAEKKLVKN